MLKNYKKLGSTSGLKFLAEAKFKGSTMLKGSCKNDQTLFDEKTCGFVHKYLQTQISYY